MLQPILKTYVILFLRENKIKFFFYMDIGLEIVVGTYFTAYINS